MAVGAVWPAGACVKIGAAMAGPVPVPLLDHFHEIMGRRGDARWLGKDFLCVSVFEARWPAKQASGRDFAPPCNLDGCKLSGRGR